MRCPNCVSDNPAAARLCGNCGRVLPPQCPACGGEITANSRFCSHCGVALKAVAPSSYAAPATPGQAPSRADAERRHLTVLFCDLAGSTEIASRLDPEDWRTAVAAYHRAAAEAVTRYGGHVAKYLGDGIMAFFGYPEAHDNDGERAVRAGLAIIDALAGVSESATNPRLAARVGIDSGEVVVVGVGGHDADVFGDTPNIAARVQAAAYPGTVLVSAHTHRLISGHFVVETLGFHSLKGRASPLELYRIIRPSGARGRLEAAAGTRGLTPFVGREDELRTLSDRWKRVSGGEGQVMLIRGEPGIGKSRLLHRFRETLAGEAHAWADAAAGAIYQNTPFHPVVEMIRQLFLSPPLSGASRGIGPPAGEPGAIAQMADALTHAGLDPSSTMSLLAPLLNLPLPPEYPRSTLPPDRERRRLLATLVEWILGTARQRPLVLATEDLHWADPSTLELIQLLVEQSTDAPLLLLYTARPEFHPPWPPRPHHGQINLDRLGAPDARAMVARVAAQKALAEETVTAVVERAAGIPLFVEELTRAVLESGEAELAGLAIPATLHDSLMARLDRLGHAKEVAQIGAVIGREFSYELLHAVYPLRENELQHHLSTLVDADLLYARDEPPDVTYRFKHALIHDAAYEALLKSRRKELHQVVARTLSQHFPSIEGYHPEVLAHHWSEAGETIAAIELWAKAGEAARSKSAFNEAERSYENALGLLNNLGASPEKDERELALRTALAAVMQITKGYSAPQTIQVNERVRQLGNQTDNLFLLVLQAASRWTALASAGDFGGASRIADEMLGLASRDGSSLGLAYAYMALMTSRYRLGELAAAEEYFARGSKFFADHSFKSAPGAMAQTYGNASQVALLMGHADTARDRIRYAISTSDDNGNPYDQAFAQFMCAMLHLLLREPEQAEVAANQSLAISEGRKFPQFAAISRVALGRARAELGDAAGGIRLIRQGMGEMNETRNRTAITVYLHWLSEAQSLNGNIVEALKSIERALNESANEVYFQSENLRFRAELWIKQGNTELGMAGFHEAITVAKRIKARTSELRAVTALTRLLVDPDRRKEAAITLLELYNGFSRGSTTRDLKEAGDLLAALGLEPI
jgi:class 3 adenylate cyclase/DNA-binding transcriptional ArsR family regulator